MSVKLRMCDRCRKDVDGLVGDSGARMELIDSDGERVATVYWDDLCPSCWKELRNRFSKERLALEPK